MSRTIALVVGILALADVASAREYRITFGGGGTRVFDQGVLAATDSSWLTNGDMGFMAEIDHGFLVGGRLRGAGSDTGPVFDSPGDFNGSINMVDLLATARWNSDLLSWLRPFLELEVGATNTVISFDISGLKDDRWGAQVAGTAGIELRLPPGMIFGGEFSLGLDFAGGYVYRMPFDFDDVDGVDLGTLDLKGPYFRVAITAMW